MEFVAQRPKAEIVAACRDHVSSGKVDFFTQYGIDFVPGRRQGVRLCDTSGGKNLINCHCDVFNLGHRHPAIIAAPKRAIDELDILGNLVVRRRPDLVPTLVEMSNDALAGPLAAAGLAPFASREMNRDCRSGVAIWRFWRARKRLGALSDRVSARHWHDLFRLGEVYRLWIPARSLTRKDQPCSISS